MRALLIAVALMSCDAAHANTQDEMLLNYVSAQLRDPSSAQFRYVERRGPALCGEVNAKNGFGGYAGFVPFFVLDQAAGSGIGYFRDAFEQELFEFGFTKFCS